MDYANDTLTNAHRHRIASQRLFQQWHSSSTSSSTSFPSAPTTMMTATENGEDLLHSHSLYNPSRSIYQNDFHNGASEAAEMTLQQTTTASTYQQQHSSPSFDHSSTLGLGATGGLHRTPSGAQKKIRQRREEKLLQNNKLYFATAASATSVNPTNTTGSGQNYAPYASPYNSSNSFNHSAASVAANGEEEDDLLKYRNLIARHGYHSILADDHDTQNGSTPNLRFPTTSTPVIQPLQQNSTPTSFSYFTSSASSSPASMFDKPTRPPRNSDFSAVGGKTQQHLVDSATNNWTPISANLATASPQNGFGHPKRSFVEELQNSLTLLPPPNANFVGGKPTVQVHPLPPPRHSSKGACGSSSSSDSPPDTLLLKKHPPPVPKKPMQNIQNNNSSQEMGVARSQSVNFGSKSVEIDQHNGHHLGGDHCPSTDSSSVVMSSISTKQQPIKQPLSPENGVNSRTRSSSSNAIASSTWATSNNRPTQNPVKSVKFVTADPYASVYSFKKLPSSMVPPPPFLTPMLSSSPSLTSLTTSLNHAFHNPDQHSQGELQELENRRIQSIESLSKKAAERQLDRKAVSEELQSIDQICTGIFQHIASFNESLLVRLNIHVLQAEQHTELEMKLRSQLERLEHGPASVRCLAEPDEELVGWRKQRLTQQLEDLQFVRAAHEARDRELDNELDELLNDDNAIMEWRFYKETLVKLVGERCQIDDKLQNVKAQLSALEAMVILPAKNSPEDDDKIATPGSACLSR